MKKALTLFLIIMLANVALAGPQYDAVYHLISKSYTLNEDGSMDYHFRKEIQLFTTAAFDTYGETFITYNTELQSLTINESYTIRKDGCRVETPKNAFNPSLPFGCTDCERFNNIREMVVTHTALEYDATIVLDYTIHTTQPFVQELMERVDLYENVPVEQYEVEVVFPHFRTLNSYLNYYGENMTQSKSEAADSTVTMRWSFTQLEPKPSDAYLPFDYMPYMLLTTVPSPGYFMEELSYQNAFLESSTEPYKEVVNDLLEGKTTEVEKILAIRDYVADNIHTNKVSIRYMNYILASPKTIWETNCATNFEKNLLLRELLRAAGFRSMFGVLFQSLMADPESALQVTADGRKYTITAASKHALSLEDIYAPDNFIALSGHVYNFEISPRQVEVSAEVQVQAVPEGLTTEVQVTKEQIVSATHRRMRPRTNPAVTAEVQVLSTGCNALQLHDSPYGCTMKAANIRRGRTVPVAVVPCEESYTYHVSLPTGVQCLSKPYSIEQSADFGSVKVEMQMQDNLLTVVRTLSLKEPYLLSKKEIRQLREMLAIWNASRDIVLMKKSK